MRTHGRSDSNVEWVCQTLRETRKRHAEDISRSEKGRQIRRENMTRRNQTAEAREVSRQTAYKTSSRPEILQVRSNNLAKWRENNPDTFYELCTHKMHNVWLSKPERQLGELLSSIASSYDFKRNQVVKSECFTWKSRRKQVDYADKAKRVYVEFDGVHHFRVISSSHVLESVRERDKLLNEHVTRNGWTLIRVSHDQFSYTRGGHFLDNCVAELTRILNEPTSGVHFIGESYEKKHV